jgi:flavin reductase (DIM6/NTAB) family NADH-FMN oxidoreductase RutF
MSTEQDFFRQVMGQFATGVTIVTTASDEGLSGLTVNAFASVSLDPPLVLICVDLKSHTLDYLRASGSFAVNFLTDKQEELSRCFATTSAERYEYFCHAPYHVAATGSPIIDGILAFIDARIVAEYPGGDHAIFLGQVQAMGTEGTVHYMNPSDKERSTLIDWNDSMTIGNNSHLTHAGEEKIPLAYYRGQYRHLEGHYQRPSLAYDKVAES